MFAISLPIWPGVILGDLVGAASGADDLTPDGGINFSKREQIARILESIKLYQQKTYNLEKVPIIQDYLKAIPMYTETQMYTLSMEIEPKAAQKNLVRDRVRLTKSYSYSGRTGRSFSISPEDLRKGRRGRLTFTASESNLKIRSRKSLTLRPALMKSTK